MELTREEIEKLANYNPITDGDNQYMDEFVARIAKQLLAEMDKPNLWKDAPGDAWHMRGVFTDRNEKQVGEFSYHRTPPKSRIDEIAEEASHKYFQSGGHMPITESEISDVIKSAILKDREERGGK